MKKTAKAAALLAAMVLAAGLTACKGKESSKGLVIMTTFVTGFTPDVPAKLSIPKEVSGIGQGAFMQCLTLTSVTIPDTVRIIGWGAFAGCTNLKSVTIGNGVEEIVKGAFMMCTNLKSVTIPASVTKIGDEVFEGCTNLKSVTIPASVTEIGYKAFSDCDKLEVKYAGTKAQWEEISKYYDIGKFVVHCTDGDVAVEVTE